MAGRRNSRTVLGVLAIVVVGFLLAQRISIECEKVLTGQSDPEISCNLSNRLFGLIKLNERTISGVTGARLDRDEKGSNDMVYRVALLTSEGEVYPTIWYSSGDISKREVIDQINHFIQDPAQVKLRTSLPLISFWEKETPLTLLLIAGILGYYAWKTWRDYKNPTREVGVDAFREQVVSESDTIQMTSEESDVGSASPSPSAPAEFSIGGMPINNSMATAINRWGGIIAVILFLMIALLIPGLKVYTLYQEGYPINADLVSKIDRVELSILLIFSGIMVFIALGFAWHTYKNWNPARNTHDVEPVQVEVKPQEDAGRFDDKLQDFEHSKENKVQEESKPQEGSGILDSMFHKLDEVQDKKVRKIIEKDFSPELKSRLFALYEPFYLTEHSGMFLDILGRAKENISEIERLAKIAEDVGYDARSWYDEVGV